MMQFIDTIINSVTMYRLVLYGLIVMVVYAVVCGFLGGLSYGGLPLIYSVVVLVVVCFVTNWLFARFFNSSTNVESWLITALILFFLFMPVTVWSDAWVLVLAGAIAMASKYILAVRKRHIFNPAAIAAVLLSFNPDTVALWWVGTPVMLPIVAIVGFLVVRKLRKFSLFFSFVGASVFGVFVWGVINGSLRFDLFRDMVLSGPLIFLGSIMLVEPLTMAPTRRLQIIAGALVGLLSTLQFHIGQLYSTPELALVVGNIFSYIVSPKQKLFFYFKKKQVIAKDTYEFVFGLEKGIASPLRGLAMTNYRAGQYMEWTLPHEHADSRGVRRFFTIASSPTEEEVRLGVRFCSEASSFKRRLMTLGQEDFIVGSGLAGDFVLPDDRSRKLVFVAGGIGVTPFRSMVKYLIEKKEKRDIVLLYFNKIEEEIAYRDIFDKAEGEIGLKAVYMLTDREHVSDGWKGGVGRLDEEILVKVIPDFRERIFYISGPSGLVNSYRSVLLRAGVSRGNVKSDFFAGY
jgi:ferredoxin-NADP reductase/Na+-transporting NADH:ubiquinone oxidoreductase subunit NqrB